MPRSSAPETVVEHRPLTLRQLLTTPYILYVEAIQDESGTWVRRASFPELEGCFVLAPTAWDAIVTLERFVITYLVDHVRQGLPVPRPPHRAVVPDLDAEELLARAGLEQWSIELDVPLPHQPQAG